MVILYTTPQLVGVELRSTVPFSTSSVPTESTVTTWIQEESSVIDLKAGISYGVTARTDLIDYDGSERIQLQYAPVIGIDKVYYSPYSIGTTEYSLTTEKTANTDYVLDKKRGELYIIYNNWSPKEGMCNILVTYTSGYTEIPLKIQMLATKRVAKRVMDSLMSYTLNESKSGKSVSVGSISITKPSDFGVSQYKALKDEIAQLEKDLIGGSSAFRYINY